MSIRISLTLAALVVAAAPLAAQGRGRDMDRVPKGHLPPPGMCRVWVDGVPPGRQAEPTDCETARRHVPSNARVVYGARADRSRDDDRWIDRILRDRDGRYEDGRYEDGRYEDGRYGGDRKSDDVGDRKSDDNGDRKYADRGDGIRIYEDEKSATRRKTGEREEAEDRADDRRESDRKLSDRKDAARKR